MFREAGNSKPTLLDPGHFPGSPRPMPGDANRVVRMTQACGFVVVKGPVTNEFHQDEKYYICNSGRRKRHVRKFVLPK